MLKLFQSANEYVEAIEMAERSMKLWSPNGYSSEYDKGEYRKAKEERDNNQRLLDKTKDRIQNQFSKIKSRQSYLEAEALSKIRDFNGWKVYHKFKSLNGAGTLDLFGEYVFFVMKTLMRGLHIQKKIMMQSSKLLPRYHHLTILPR